MVIVIFTESYYPYNCGVTEAVQNLAKNLRTQEHTVYIITPDYPLYSCGGDWVIRIPSYRIKERNYRAAWPIFSKGLIDKIISLKPDILHSHGPYATHRLASIIAKKLHIPLVMTWHTLIIDYMECWMKEVKFSTPIINLASWIAKKFWIKLWCDQTDLILAPTHFVQDMLRSYHVKAPIEVLPLAINLEEIPWIDPAKVKELKDSLHINHNDQVLLYLGRVTPEKNIDLLLEVFKKILYQRADCHLVIVGGGNQNGRYQMIADNLGISRDKITFTGEIPRDKTSYYYQMASLFLFASTTDNTPRSILEAMQFMPVVAVRAGGVPDLVLDSQTGFLVEPDDIVNGMARAALHILNSPVLEESMTKSAQEEVNSGKYDPSKYAKTVEGIYRDLINQHKSNN